MPELLPFQQEGVALLRGQNMLLGDQAGTGKTAQMIAITRGYKRVLILTMASLKYQMRDEIHKWIPDAKVIVVNGSPKQRSALWNTNNDNQYWIANYELLLKDWPQMSLPQWNYIVADECTRLSNHTNKQWKALKLLNCDHKLAMTGTAISNSPLDCYGIIEWLRPGVLGNFWAFSSRYVVKDQWGAPRYFVRMDELAKRIKPYYIRRTKEQVLPELPEKRQIDVPFVLSQKERKLYDQLKSEILFEIEQAEINKIEHISQLQNGLVKLIRLRQLTCSMELMGDSRLSTKLTVLKDLLLTLNTGKVIIFCEFAQMCKILQRELFAALMIIGETPTEERAKIVNKFNTDPDANILVMSSAGAYGLNLQAADTVIHYDLPWSVAKYEQRAARSHRQGQKNTVFEYTLLAQQSVDTYVRKKLNNKQLISDKLMPLSELKEMLDEI